MFLLSWCFRFVPCVLFVFGVQFFGFFLIEGEDIFAVGCLAILKTYSTQKKPEELTLIWEK